VTIEAMMVTATATRRASRRPLVPDPGRRATRIVVGALGALIGLAGVEHGVGELSQGSTRPEGLLIESWPDVAGFEVLSGEPAMTVVPDLLVTGVLAILVGLSVAAWSIWFVGRSHGGLVLIGLSVLLLLVGGGLFPPLMGIVVGTVAARMGRANDVPPRPWRRAVAPAWPWFLTASLVGYLGLVPGMVLASRWGWASEALVLMLGAVAFAGFGFALVAAPAYDRLQMSRGGEPGGRAGPRAPAVVGPASNHRYVTGSGR
jgi:hypothetical protein